MTLSEKIRDAALGDAPNARGGNPLSAWLREDDSFVAAMQCKHTGEGFTFLTTDEQRMFLLIVSYSLEE